MGLLLDNSDLELQVISCVTAEERIINGDIFIFSGLKIQTGSQIDYVGNVFEPRS